VRSECADSEKTTDEPPIANRDSLYLIYENAKSLYSADSLAFTKFYDNVKSEMDYYISVGDKYTGPAKSGINKIYKYFHDLDVSKVAYVSSVSGDTIAVNVDYDGTDSSAGLFWHVGSSLPSGLTSSDTGKVVVIFSSSTYPGNEAGLTATGYFFSNLLPSPKSNSAYAKLVSHEGYHALVRSGVDPNQDMYDALDAKMLMYYMMTDSNAIQMNGAQWGNLRDGILKSR